MVMITIVLRVSITIVLNSTNNDSVNNNEEKSGEKQDPNKTSNTEETNADRKQRSMSVDTSETLSRQVEIANDEVRLLRNKIARLEDDLLIVTQVIYFI